MVGWLRGLAALTGFKESDEASSFDVGREGMKLRLWYARRAMEHGERRLDLQRQNHDGLIARATSLLNWSITVTAALLAAAIAHKSTAPAAVGAFFGMMTAVFCVMALQPVKWLEHAHSPAWLISEPYRTELEALESMAAGYAQYIDTNLQTLLRCARWLRFAWTSFLLVPGGGLVAYLITA